MKSHSELTLTGKQMIANQPIHEQQVSCSTFSSLVSDIEDNMLTEIELTSISDLDIIGMAKKTPAKAPKKSKEEEEDDDFEFEEDEFEEDEFDFEEDFEDDFDDLDFIDDEDIDFDDDFF